MTLKSKSNWIFPKKAFKADILKYILKNRDIKEEEFLNINILDIPSFENMYDSRKAAKEIVKSIKKGEKIVVHGDFDADGICSVSLLWDFLYRRVGMPVDVVPYIPSRVEQGYGLTESSLNDVIKLGGKLLISVDCGVRDKELITRYIKEGKLNFVITDHHQPPDDLDSSLKYPLVHPMYPNHSYPYSQVCGTYVTFMLIQAIKSELGIESEINEDTLGLDLVALATVTDLMPLVDVNRVVVKTGIEQINKGSRLGLNELIKISGLEVKDIDSYHLGYILGPRINAAGRIGSPLDAVKLLVSDKVEICKKISNVLNETNFQRQFLTQNGLDEAIQAIGDNKEKVIFVINDQWHEGIIGLIAGKLNEKYNKPVLVGTRSEEGVRGSARSISGFNITKALERCSKYLERYGGHELAAGFSIKKNKEKEFSECIKGIANKEITDRMLIKDLKIDAVIESDNVNLRLSNELDMLKPFGYGNPKPLISLRGLIVFKKQILGKLGNHMKLVCKGKGVDLITLILFNCDEDVEEMNIDDIIDVVGGIGINSWNGNQEVQFVVKEWRYSI